MQSTDLKIQQADIHKLLCAANPDAALLYIYLQCGNPLKNARQELALNQTRLDCAAATLRQLGLYQEEKARLIVGERPQYSETDVLTAMDTDNGFKGLYGEIQRLLGRTLNTEELKILLGFVRYLGLPEDVISVLVCYCKERARQRGSLRNPSLRTIEKEAYAWAEQGIDTMEEAVAYMRKQAMRRSRMGQLMEALQIRGRNLTPGEEKYAQQWLDWGFNLETVKLAYERTCLNTGGLSWAYMNKILSRWQEKGLLTVEQVQQKDTKTQPKGASGQLGDAELEAIQRVLREG